MYYGNPSIELTPMKVLTHNNATAPISKGSLNYDMNTLRKACAAVTGAGCSAFVDEVRRRIDMEGAADLLATTNVRFAAEGEKYKLTVVLAITGLTAPQAP